MKSIALDHLHHEPEARAEPAAGPRLFDRLRALAIEWRQARLDRRRQGELAALDDSVLRDIGFDEGEISRLRCRGEIVPRAWVG
jgi:uncharacterized protein YjiS (DUF1127 family)